MRAESCVRSIFSVFFDLGAADLISCTVYYVSNLAFRYIKCSSLTSCMSNPKRMSVQSDPRNSRAIFVPGASLI